MGETTFANMVTLYESYEREAVEEIVEGTPVRIWRGPILEHSNNLGISVGAHNRATRLLKLSGCIQLLQQGSVAGPTVLALFRHPVPDDSVEQDLTPRGRPGKIVPRLDAIERQIGGVDLVKALSSVEERLSLVESAVTELVKGSIRTSQV